MNRRTLLRHALAAPLAVGAPATLRAAAPRLHVARSPSCGCCGAWVEHMRAAGFEPRVEMTADDRLAALKARLGLPGALWSCHTAQVEGYVVEGHVPAADALRLLAERPVALGLAVPGMPVGSPGMEMGARVEPFDTLLVARDGATAVFAEHR